MQDKLYEIIINKDEITWQSLIYDLIKSGQLDPWDVDISLLSKRYIEALKQLKEANFFISGKVLLAAAFLLKIKSEKLVNEDFAEFDSLLYPKDVNELLKQDYIRDSTKTIENLITETIAKLGENIVIKRFIRF